MITVKLEAGDKVIVQTPSSEYVIEGVRPGNSVMDGGAMDDVRVANSASETLKRIADRIENMRDGAIFERNKYEAESHAYAYFQATTNAFNAVLNAFKEEGI